MSTLSCRCVAIMRSVVFVLTAKQLSEMEERDPFMLLIVQAALMKSVAMWGTNTMQQFYPAPWKRMV